jgi:hypothetical protein
VPLGDSEIILVSTIEVCRLSLKLKNIIEVPSATRYSERQRVSNGNGVYSIYIEELLGRNSGGSSLESRE